MIGSKKSPEKSSQLVRTELAAGLRDRAPEIEKAISKQIRKVPAPAGDEDPVYVAGLQRAVSEALTYALEGIEKGSESSIPIPPETARQARRAAREGVRLDTVMRRYIVGNKVLEQFILAGADGIPRRMLCHVLNDQGPHVDRLMESVAAEYWDELEQTTRSSTQKNADRIIRLLASDSLEAPIDLGYDLDAWHIGIILNGHNAEMAAHSITERSGYASLRVARGPESAWAWLGSPRKFHASDIEKVLVADMPKSISVALGEPRKALDGWRLTHCEAQIALQVSLSRPQTITRCRDVILVSAALQDPSLATSLVETYLTPLDGRGDFGQVLRKTLRAYFKADRNVVAAASALGVDRRTVERRLRNVEEKLHLPLATYNAQLQVALSVEELADPV